MLPSKDVEFEDGSITISAPPTEFFKAKRWHCPRHSLPRAGNAGNHFYSAVHHDSRAEQLALFEKLQGMLNDYDDVLEIYNNVTHPRLSCVLIKLSATLAQ
jgi:transcriptional/translational regulatory protein YebC/TACO1